MKNAIEFLTWFVGLVLLQVLLLNNLQIVGYVNPFLYIYIIVALPIQTNRVALLFVGFLLGLVLDMFANTWGIHTIATTLISFLRPYVLRLVSTQEELDRIMPRFRTMGGNYLKYVFLIVLIHHLLLFVLEAFSFRYFWIVLVKTFVSSVITVLLMLVIEKLRK
jgi:rod shape-determining protein MreD